MKKATNPLALDLRAGGLAFLPEILPEGRDLASTFLGLTVTRAGENSALSSHRMDSARIGLIIASSAGTCPSPSECSSKIISQSHNFVTLRIIWPNFLLD